MSNKSRISSIIMDYFGTPDPLGVRSIIQANFNSSLTGELERLFVNEQAQRRRMGSGSSDNSNSSSVWEEFSRNGREGELDDLDRLFRGMDINLSAGLQGRYSSRSVPPPYSVNVMIPPPSLGSASEASTSSGSPTSSQEDDFSDLLTSARMFEILKERERQKRKKANKPKATGKVCVFCRNNGEAEAVYTSHQLKDAMGRITCPVLFIYTCPICSARGENAHTIKYCPYNPGTLDQGKCLKTPRMAVGRRRLTPHLTPMAPLSPQ